MERPDKIKQKALIRIPPGIISMFDPKSMENDYKNILKQNSNLKNEIDRLYNHIALLNRHIRDQREDKRRYEEEIDNLKGYSTAKPKSKYLTVSYRKNEKSN